MKSSSYSATSGAIVASKTYDVAVVGGGLVGVAFALACAQAGLEVTLVSGTSSAIASEEKWDRRVYAISPASRRFLQALKIWPQLNAARIAPVPDMRVFGAALAHVSSPASSPASSTKKEAGALHFSAYQIGTEALAWIVEHRELVRVLEIALGFQQGLTRIRSTAESFELTVERADIVTMQGTIAARLLVGADGAYSRVREALAWPSESKPYGQTGVVANFSCSKSHGGTAHQWFTAMGIVALLPLPTINDEHAVSLVWSAPDALAQTLLQESGAALAQRLTAITGSTFGDLKPLSGVSGFPLELLTTARQVGLRSVLIGDAAHVVHPLAGQGLNLGFQDAEILCNLLREREVFRDCGNAVLLRRYERMRKAPVWAMLQATDGLQQLFGNDDRLAGTMRRAGMNLIDRLPVIKQALIRQATGS